MSYITSFLIIYFILNVCSKSMMLSCVRGLCDKNKRGFSGFNEGVYLNPCSDYTQQI
jgi:hypothetical protein